MVFQIKRRGFRCFVLIQVAGEECDPRTLLGKIHPAAWPNFFFFERHSWPNWRSCVVPTVTLDTKSKFSVSDWQISKFVLEDGNLTCQETWNGLFWEACHLTSILIDSYESWPMLCQNGFSFGPHFSAIIFFAQELLFPVQIYDPLS